MSVGHFSKDTNGQWRWEVAKLNFVIRVNLPSLIPYHFQVHQVVEVEPKMFILHLCYHFRSQCFYFQ